MYALTRRETVRGLAAFGAGCALLPSCTPASTDSAGNADSTCTEPTTGDDVGYCLVAAERVRVAGGTGLAVGSALLANVDDNTAVLVGRDAGGYYARSAICTHQCCIVALCSDTDCALPNPTPDACQQAGPSTGDHVLCPCHGSVFRISDGQPINGPAVEPLPAYSVALDGEDLLVDTAFIVDVITRA